MNRGSRPGNISLAGSSLSSPSSSPSSKPAAGGLRSPGGSQPLSGNGGFARGGPGALGLSPPSPISSSSVSPLLSPSAGLSSPIVPGLSMNRRAISASSSPKHTPVIQDYSKAPQHPTSVFSIGVQTEDNRRWRRTMEDAHIIIDGFNGHPKQLFAAVYDGHGGRASVDYVEKNLHNFFLEELAASAASQSSPSPSSSSSSLMAHSSPPSSLLAASRTLSASKDALERAYVRVDAELIRRKILYEGTTSVTAFVEVIPTPSSPSASASSPPTPGTPSSSSSSASASYSRRLLVANCGDSRAVLCRNGQAIRMSFDHKATDLSEAKRIQIEGGFVTMGRVNGILTVTRAFGDVALKTCGVTCYPYMQEMMLDEHCQFLIVACDGVWDVCSDQEAVDLIKSEKDSFRAATKLVKTALELGSTDNISCIVIRF